MCRVHVSLTDAVYAFALPAALRRSGAETMMAQEASPVMLTVVRPMSKMRSTPAAGATPSTGRPTL